MADNRLLRNTPEKLPTEGPAVTLPAGETAAGKELPAGAKVPGVKEDTLNSIVQWIPLETIGAYVFLQSLFLDPLKPEAGQTLHDLNYDARWNVFYIGLALTVLAVPLYTAVKQRQATANFAMPWGETVIATIAFVLWAAALPDTPAGDWKWWTPDYGVAAIAVSAVFLSPIATLLNIRAQWGKTPAS